MICPGFHSLQTQISLQSLSPSSIHLHRQTPVHDPWANPHVALVPPLGPLFSHDGTQMRLHNFPRCSELGPSVLQTLAFFSDHSSPLPHDSGICTGSTSGEKTRHGKQSLFLVPSNGPLENRAGRDRSLILRCLNKQTL